MREWGGGQGVQTSLVKFCLHCSLEDILHQDSKLYLVFEFMQMDLKKYIDTVNGDLDPMLVKVTASLTSSCLQTLHTSHPYQITFFFLNIWIIWRQDWSTGVLFLSTELHVSDSARDCILSLTSYPSSWPKAAESSHRCKGSHQAGWLWAGKSLWNSRQSIHAWGEGFLHII